MKQFLVSEGKRLCLILSCLLSQTFLRKTKFLIVLILVSVHFSLSALPIYAQDASTSAEEKDSIQDKVKAIIQEAASKAADLKNDVNKKTQNKMFFGSVSITTFDSIKLEGSTEERTIRTNEYTTYQNNSSKKGTLDEPEDFSRGEYLIALGDLDDKGVLTAIKIIKVDEIAEQKETTIFGKVLEVADNLIKLLTRDNRTLNISLGNNTEFQRRDGEINRQEIKPSISILVNGLQKQSSISAKFIYYISSGDILKPTVKGQSTSSANQN